MDEIGYELCEMRHAWQTADEIVQSNIRNEFGNILEIVKNKNERWVVRQW